MVLNGAEIVARVLIEQGVDTVFGYPGAAVLNIYDALYQHRGEIQHVLTAHEQGAAHCADGYARASGRTGVVLATSGPGAANLVTGVAAAYMDSTPMVVLTGNVGTALIGKDSFQEVYIMGITMSVTKHNYVVRRVEELADILRDAFYIANSGRKGPVLVDIPKDVTAASCRFEPRPAVRAEHEEFHNQAALAQAAQAINGAERPLLLFGGGVAASDAGEETARLASLADMPVCHTMMGIGGARIAPQLDLGMAGMHGAASANKAVAQCDVLVAVGTRFSDRVALNPREFAPGARVIHIDIDQSEVNKNVKTDVSLVGDVKKVLDKLLPLLRQGSHIPWRQAIAAWQQEDFVPGDDSGRLKPHQIMETIGRLAGEEAIVTTDVGQHQIWAAQYLKRTQPRTFLTSGGLGAMGFGYGAAIGAKRALPDRPVVHITGDGSFHMNLNECCTAVTYGLPVVTVILNNRALGMVHQWQHVFYEDRFSATNLERRTDYPALAKAFGADGERCETLAQLEAALRRGLAARTPYWIECVVDRDEKVMPMIPAGGTLDDMITGKDCKEGCEKCHGPYNRRK